MSRFPHVAIYARVSTKEQDENGLSMDAQPAACLKRLDEEFGPGGYTYELFEDRGKSGGLGPMPWATQLKPKERKELFRLMQGVREGGFTHVIAFRGDRIYRNQLGALAFYVELLKPRGVRLMYAAEAFDESLAGQMTAGVLATVAEFQRRQIGENIEKTLEFRRDGGYYLGTHPFGWRKETEEEHAGRRPNILPDPEHAPTVVRIKDLFLSGMSETAIAALLNRERVPHKKSVGRWTAGTVNLVLTCPVHAGLVRKNKEGDLQKGLHHAHRLYEEGDYRRILERLERTRKRLRGVARTQPFRLFSGLAHCGHCGKRMHSHFHTEHPGYRCLGDSYVKDGSHVYVSAGQLEELVVRELKGVAADARVRTAAEDEVERLVRSQDDELRSEAQTIRRAIEDLRRQESKVSDALAEGAMPSRAAKAKYEELEALETAHQTRLAEIAKVLDAAETRQHLARCAKERLADFDLLWESMTDAERRECLHTVLERVDVHATDERKWMRLTFATGAEPREVEILRGAERYRKHGGPASLTPRELAALKHVLDGAHYTKVAEHFESTPTNAHTILQRTKVKLGAKTYLETAQRAEFLIRRHLGDLPLYGKCEGPRSASKSLKTTEHQILLLSQEGLSSEAIAVRTGIHVERVRELLASGLGKCGAETVAEAVGALAERPELLPPTVRNRRRKG